MRWLATVFFVAVAACSTPVQETETTSPPPTEATATTAFSQGDVTGFPVDSILVDGTTYHVAVADNNGRRNRGLRGVTDLGSLTGMLFVFEADVSVAFTMRDTLIPLDLVLIAEAGEVLEIIEMDPCDGPDCRFPPSVLYRYALEVPQGSLEVAVGDVIGLPE